eukprot:COSAG06_NODE_853_length_11950_cov_3.644249_8_plen_81_part_00
MLLAIVMDACVLPWLAASTRTELTANTHADRRTHTQTDKRVSDGTHGRQHVPGIKLQKTCRNKTEHNKKVLSSASALPIV